MVFQRDALLDWRTVLDNVLLPIDFRRGDRARGCASAARELLALIGLHGFEKAIPGSSPAACASASRSAARWCTIRVLLLMDEPFGALDALTRDQMNIELQRIWLARRTRPCCSSPTASPRRCSSADRVVVMTPRPGRIVDLIADRPAAAAARSRCATSERFNGYANHIRTLFEGMGLLKEDAHEGQPHRARGAGRCVPPVGGRGARVPGEADHPAAALGGVRRSLRLAGLVPRARVRTRCS